MCRKTEKGEVLETGFPCEGGGRVPQNKKGGTVRNMVSS